MELVLENIRKRFGDTEVLKGCSYAFERGKIYGLLGRNGAGKTTLFHVLTGDLPREGGEVRLDGAPIVPEDIGLVESQPIVPEFLTGYEFLKYFLEMRRPGEKITAEEIQGHLSSFLFTEADGQKLIGDYSHGMKSKINLLALTLSAPKVMLLDEPLTSLDVVASDEMKKLMMGKSDQAIIILSTHMLELAHDLCDEIVLLTEGRLVGLKDLRKDDPDYAETIIRKLKEDAGA